MNFAGGRFLEVVAVMGGNLVESRPLPTVLQIEVRHHQPVEFIDFCLQGIAPTFHRRVSINGIPGPGVACHECQLTEPVVVLPPKEAIKVSS